MYKLVYQQIKKHKRHSLLAHASGQVSPGPGEMRLFCPQRVDDVASPNGQDPTGKLCGTRSCRKALRDETLQGTTPAHNTCGAGCKARRIP